MRKIKIICFAMLFLGTLNSYAYENRLTENKNTINIPSGTIEELNLMTGVNFYAEDLMQEIPLLGELKGSNKYLKNCKVHLLASIPKSSSFKKVFIQGKKLVCNSKEFDLVGYVVNLNKDFGLDLKISESSDKNKQLFGSLNKNTSAFFVFTKSISLEENIIAKNNINDLIRN